MELMKNLPVHPAIIFELLEIIQMTDTLDKQVYGSIALLEKRWFLVSKSQFYP